MLFYIMKMSEIYNEYLDSNGVSTDTRKIEANQIFFALSGENFNGNKFALQAIEKGARWAIIDDENYQNSQTILVDNVLQTLQELANYHRKQLSIPVIGLTGTNGKTSTKELLHAALAQKFNVAATKGNLNNHIGVPLTLLEINDSHEIAIVEMGANGPDDIKELCNIALPSHGFITNIGKAHLEGFGSENGVLHAKKQLYDFLSQSEGTIFYNQDDTTLTNILPKNTTNIPYGKSLPPMSSEVISCDPFLKFSLANQEVQSQLTGEYNFYNFLTAATSARHFGVGNEQLKTAFEAYRPSNSRSQIEKGKNTLIIDAYNANPSSMKLAIENIAKMSGQRFVILGDMKELGEYSAFEHQNICDQLNELGIDEGILIGEAFSKCSTALHQVISTDKGIEELKNLALKGKTILIKGSRSIALERTLPYLR
jgi:UDP-N-acetylmuramoyl-tripeptide--D-alanyl-D-alanine ligase